MACLRGVLVALLMLGCGTKTGGDTSSSGSGSGSGSGAGTGGATGDSAADGATEARTEGRGAEGAAGDDGGDEACPPCMAPPAPDCVGSGPCGCGPYTCPSCDADAAEGLPCDNNPEAYGWAWNGTECVTVVGCGCDGEDCENLAATELDCATAHAHCGL